jgi:hypothetical protein
MMLTVEKEQKYAPETGVVNLAKLQRLKEVIQAIDTAAYPIEHGIVRLLPCTDATVARLAKCVYLHVTNADTGESHDRRVAACDDALAPYEQAATR